MESTKKAASAMEIKLPGAGVEELFGTGDRHLRQVEKTFGVRLSARGEALRIVGDPEACTVVADLFAQLGRMQQSGHALRPTDFDTAIRILSEAPETSLASFFSGEGILGSVRGLVKPRSLRQFEYLKAMAEHDLVIAIGPAGTGKTYLAVAMAAAALQEKKIRRIVLARPAVEAGEKLGFLPGDLEEKVNPYLRPLYDALYDIIGFDRVARMMDRGTIEVAPIAFMRGRTLNDSFVILDEAQNTTSEQMKMFLTRIGMHSQAVITGDVTQVDLPPGKVSGLKEARQVLAGVSGLTFVHLNERDVVRHQLVQRIIQAYERYDQREEMEDSAAPRTD